MGIFEENKSIYNRNYWKKCLKGSRQNTILELLLSLVLISSLFIVIFIFPFYLGPFTLLITQKHVMFKKWIPQMPKLSRSILWNREHTKSNKIVGLPWSSYCHELLDFITVTTTQLMLSKRRKTKLHPFPLVPVDKTTLQVVQSTKFT